jgi:hypothetical protein
VRRPNQSGDAEEYSAANEIQVEHYGIAKTQRHAKPILVKGGRKEEHQGLADLLTALRTGPLKGGVVF